MGATISPPNPNKSRNWFRERERERKVEDINLRVSQRSNQISKSPHGVQKITLHIHPLSLSLRRCLKFFYLYIIYLGVLFYFFLKKFEDFSIFNLSLPLSFTHAYLFDLQILQSLYYQFRRSFIFLSLEFWKFFRVFINSCEDWCLLRVLILTFGLVSTCPFSIRLFS